jgi:hypothetical protein
MPVRTVKCPYCGVAELRYVPSNVDPDICHMLCYNEDCHKKFTIKEAFPNGIGN